MLYTLQLRRYVNNVLDLTQANRFLRFYNTGINGESYTNVTTNFSNIPTTYNIELTSTTGHIVLATVSTTGVSADYNLLLNVPYIFNNEIYICKFSYKDHSNDTEKIYTFILSNITKTITINIDTTGNMFKPSPVFIYNPVDNNIYGYDLANHTNISVVHTIGTDVISRNLNTILSITKDCIITSVYTQIVNDVATNITVNTQLEYISNVIQVTSSITDDGYFKINDRITKNTSLIANQIFNFTANSYLNIAPVIGKSIFSKLFIETLSKTTNYTEYLNTKITANPIQLHSLFTSYVKGFNSDTIAKLDSFVPYKFGNTIIPTTQSFITLQEGHSYYVNRIGTTASSKTGTLTYSGNTITLTLNESFTVDMSQYVTSLVNDDNLIMAASNNSIELIECTTAPKLNINYIVVTSTGSINSVTQTKFDIVYFKTTNQLLQNLYLIPASLKVIDLYEVEFKGIEEVELLYNNDYNYTLYNKSLSIINLEIYKLNYENEIVTEEILKDTLSILSNNTATLTFNEDGIYKFIINNEVYYFVSYLNIELCILQFINSLICDNGCITSKCSLYSKTNYTAASTLYKLLKDLTTNILGDRLYNSVLESNIAKLHSINDIITRANKFCNCITIC